MKQTLLLTSILTLIFNLTSSTIKAQSFGIEQNANGSYTFDFGGGISITTNTSGSYSSSGSGMCIGCANILPEVTVYGYRNTATNTVTYESYSYQGEYYEMPQASPPPSYVPYYTPPVTVINTTPSPVPAPPPVVTPCKDLAENVMHNSTALTHPQNASAAASLKSTLATDVNEKSAIMGVNTTNGTLTAIINPAGGPGGTGQVTVPPGMYLMGSMHTHPSNVYPAPSAGDIYAIATINATKPGYTSAYVFAADGSQYLLKITDSNKAAAFLVNYPPATTVSGASWIADPLNPTAIYSDFNAIDKNINPTAAPGALDEKAFETAQAYILDKYDTGITMLKADASGNFKEVHFVKTTNASGNTVYVKFNCK